MEYMGKEILKINEIVIDELFDDLQPLEGSELDEIIIDMREKGYNPLFSIGVWRKEINGKIIDIVFDGHRRIYAAARNGMLEIPAEIFKFENVDEAFEAAIKTIGFKRDRNDFSIYSAVRKTRKLNKVGIATGYGLERARLARLLGTNEQKIQYTFSLLEYIDENPVVEDTMIKYVKEKSINFVYKTYLKKDNKTGDQEQKEENKNAATNGNDEVDNTSGNWKVEVKFINGENVDEHSFNVKNINDVKAQLLKYFKQVAVA